MNRILDILVPQYQETQDVVKVLLDSIAVQQGISFDDIGVIIVNDGAIGTDGYLPTKFLRSYPFHIEWHTHEHKGVSATRNACLDYSTAEYVMFCDADDCFISGVGLYRVLGEIKAEHPDSIFSKFYEETRHPETGEPIFIVHSMDSTFVHGKIHRRQFLIDKNIRWNENLLVHEDSYFNVQCQRLADNLRYCNEPFYLWRYRANSICRHDEDYILKTYAKLLDSMDALVSNFVDRGEAALAQEYATAAIYDAYFTLNQGKWLSVNNEEYRKEVERRFAGFYSKYWGMLNEISPQQRLKIVADIRMRFFDEGLISESITFDDWILHILADYTDNQGET